MAAMRRLAPELMLTAKTQRWNPEEFLRTLIEAEITARDASNARTRMRLAAFPVFKTLDQFQVGPSWIPPATFDYLASLEWIRAAGEHLPDRAGRHRESHLLVVLGVAAVHAGHRVRYFTAADLVETLYRSLADNSVGRVIDTLLRNDLIIVDLCRHRDYAECGGEGAGQRWSMRSVTRHSPGRSSEVSFVRPHFQRRRQR